MKKVVVTGTLTGLWSTPVPATLIVTRQKGGLCAVTTQLAAATIDISDVRFFSFSTPIPEGFRPAKTQNVLALIWAESGFAVEAAPAIMQVSPAGALTFWQADLGFFADDTPGGFTDMTSGAWRAP